MNDPNPHIGFHTDTKEIFIDNTCVDTFRQCPQKFYYRMVLGLVESRSEFDSGPIPKAAPLLFGAAIHEALDVWFHTGDVIDAQDRFVEAYQPVPEDALRTVERGRNLLMDYAIHWKDDNKQWTGVLSELAFRTTLGEVMGWTVIYTGLIDKILFDDSGSVQVMDHKTSTWNTQNIIQSFELSNQFRGYGHLIRENGYPSCETFLVDLILIGRVSKACPQGRNDYQRHPIQISTETLEHWKKCLFQTVRMMIDCHESRVFPEYGHNACTHFNKLCPYFSLCATKPENRTLQADTFFEVERWTAVRN